MARSPTLTPLHSLVKKYYATLQELRAQDVEHELGLRRAFETLLAESARLRGWTLVGELSTESRGRTVVPDGTIRDRNYLPRGYWEAKDTRDDLKAEIRKKIERGYPTTNIIFEDTRRAVLFVAAEKALKAARRTPDVPEVGDKITHPDQLKGRPKSFGDQVVASDWYKHVKQHGAKGESDPVGQLNYGVKEMKTLFETTAGLAPESTRTGLIVDAVTRPIQILDIIPTTPTGQAAFVYLEETTRTHAAAEKAEAAAYAESTFALTERSSTVRKITDSIPVTDEQLADEPVVNGYLSGRLEFGLRQRLDGQLITGDGTPPNLTGILNVAGIQTQAKGVDPTFDTAMKALTLVRVTGRAVPNAFIMHPNDWETLVLTRTADGIYILGNPQNQTTNRLWGLLVVVSDAITENTGLTGDFANFSILAERQGVQVRTGFVNDDFTKGRVTMRGDLRVAFAVTRATAFCTMTGI